MDPVDCRLHHIHGFEHFKTLADAELSKLDAGRRRAIVFTVEDSNLLYVQYNFKFERHDDFDLKMLQTVGYLKVVWKFLRDNHQLEEVCFVESTVPQRLGSLFGRDGESLVELRELSVPNFVAPSHTLKKPGPRPNRLFVWLEQKGDWLGRLEGNLDQYRRDEVVDEDTLPEPLLELKVKLAQYMLEASRRDDSQQLLRGMNAFHGLSRYSAESRQVALYQARAMSRASEDDDADVAALMACSISRTHALKAISCWGDIEMLMLTSLNSSGGIDELRRYFQLASLTMDSRVLLEDPNAFMRLYLGELGLFDMLAEALLRSERDIVAYGFCQIGRYRDAIGNHAAAKDAYERALEAPLADDTHRYRSAILDAGFRLAEMCAEAGDRAKCLQHLDQVRARLKKWGDSLDLTTTLKYEVRLLRYRCLSLLLFGDPKGYQEAGLANDLVANSKLASIDPAISTELGTLWFEMACLHRAQGRDAEFVDQMERALASVRGITDFKFALEGEEKIFVVSMLEPYLVAMKAARALIEHWLGKDDVDQVVPILQRYVPLLTAMRECAAVASFIELMPTARAKLQGVNRTVEADMTSEMEKGKEMVVGFLKNLPRAPAEDRSE